MISSAKRYTSGNYHEHCHYSLAAIDLLSIGVIFWLVPDAIARLVKGRLQDGGPRPIRFFVDQLTGLMVSTVLGAFVHYFTVVSYESFVVNTSRAVGDFALETMGLDEMSICKQRVTVTHFPMTSGRQFREVAISFQDSGHPTIQDRDNILMRGQMFMAIDGSTTNVMERSIESLCSLKIERG